MNTRGFLALALLTGATVLGGCATSRSEIKIASPAATPVAPPSASARSVVIRSVKDERVFEQAPRQASNPSLGADGATTARDEIKARAIGRKRNTFGQALGDVLLDKGQTVTGLVRENLSAAFQQAGFRVLADGAGAPAALLVEVRIKQFWAWLQPGFWALTLNTNIETELDLSGAAGPIKLSVHAEDSRQIATDSAWLEIVEKALVAYRAQAAARVGTAPF